jgi:hypothetical protein
MGNVAADGGDISHLPAGESVGGFLQRRGMAPDGVGGIYFVNGNCRTDGQFSIPDFYFTQFGQSTYIQQMLGLQGTGTDVDHHVRAPGQNSGVRSVLPYKIESLA